MLFRLHMLELVVGKVLKLPSVCNWPATLRTTVVKSCRVCAVESFSFVTIDKNTVVSQLSIHKHPWALEQSSRFWPSCYIDPI